MVERRKQPTTASQYCVRGTDSLLYQREHSATRWDGALGRRHPFRLGTRSESGMFSCPYDPRCGRLGTWPSPAIVPVTPSIGLALSAPDTLTQHDDRWTFRGRRHRPAHGHDLQAVYGTIAIAAA